MQVDASENDEKSSFSARVGKKLRSLRRQRGWSQTDMAERLNLSMATISNLETGRTQITVDYLVAFAAALGLAPGDFFKEVEAEPNEQAVISAIRGGDRLAAADALARALGVEVEELVASHQPNPALPLDQVEAIGRNAAQLAWTAAVVIAGSRGGDPDGVLAMWATTASQNQS